MVAARAPRRSQQLRAALVRQEHHRMSLSTLLDRAEKAPKRTSDVPVLFNASVVDRLEALENEQQQVQADLDVVMEDLDVELEALERDLRNSDPRPAAARKAARKLAVPLETRIRELADEIEAVNASVADELVTFRFTALDGWEWAEITSRSVPREGVAEDSGRAYNLDEVSKIAAARTGVIVSGDSTMPVSKAEWDRVWKIAPAPALTQIKMALWYLNEYQWDAAREAALNAARKASEAKVAATQP